MQASYVALRKRYFEIRSVCARNPTVGLCTAERAIVGVDSALRCLVPFFGPHFVTSVRHFLSSLAAEDAHEAAHSFGLPADGLHDFGQSRAFRVLHDRDYFGLCVPAVGFGLGGRLLGPGGFLR